MFFIFSPHIQAGIASGTYEVVKNASGVLLGIARDKASGQFVAHAISAVCEPFLVLPQILFGTGQLVQTHLGFQKTYKMLEALQASVGVLQATTALIGMGTVAGVTLSAVNLHQTLKLRKDVEQLRLEVTNGFIDLKKALKDESAEIIKRIDQVADDVEFKHHRTILVQAYGRFTQAVNWLGNALKVPDENARNAQIAGVQTILHQALGDYNNAEIYKETSAPGRLRRLECAWVIDQTITMTYQWQSAYEVVSDRLSHLQAKIRQDSLALIEHCKSDDELDFLFPEITRIHTQDVPLLEAWKNKADWMHALTPDERQQLASLDATDTASSDNNNDSSILAESAEQALYERLKEKSHYRSLLDQLRFIAKPDLRRNYESYIRQQAIATNYQGLGTSNWQEISDLTVANLYHFFKVREESDRDKAIV